MKYDAFISYSSKDKASFVTLLATKLTSFGFKIWYDEYELEVGDSIRKSIDKGLNQSFIGIIILSKNFFKRKWSQYELDGLIQLMNSAEKKLLPIWHNLSHKDLIKIAPSLADLVALQSNNKSVDEIVDELKKVLGRRQFTLSGNVVKISKDYYPLSQDARERGFETLSSIHKDIIIDEKITHIKLQKIIVPSYPNFKSFNFYHWQEDSGEIKLNGTDVFDAVTGELIKHSSKIIKNNGCEFHLQLNFKKLALNPITIIVEINTTNYFYNLFKNGYGYTEFTILYRIKNFQYYFITPNQARFKNIRVSLENETLSKTLTKNEISSSFQVKNLSKEKNLRFIVTKK